MRRSQTVLGYIHKRFSIYVASAVTCQNKNVSSGFNLCDSLTEQQIKQQNQKYTGGHLETPTVARI